MPIQRLFHRCPPNSKKMNSQFEHSENGLYDDAYVSCLLTHKCKPENHKFIDLTLCPIFRAHSVNLQRDPFEPGVEVLARIQALEFQALMFLYSSESWKSKYCREELAAAQKAYIPVFAISQSREVPPALRSRIFLVYQVNAHQKMLSELHDLAQATRVRGSIRALLQRLRFPNTPEIVRHSAQRLADEPDCTALTEFLDCIEWIYTHQMDPIARASLAFAVGKTRTQRAKQILLGWRSPEDHPYPQECISQALVWVNNKYTHNKEEIHEHSK